MSNNEAKKRLDMKESLYEKILSYAGENSIEGRTRGERVLKSVEHMQERIFRIDTSLMVNIDEEIKKKIKLFQMVGILDDGDISKAINEALLVYIQEHKGALQKKVEEL